MINTSEILFYFIFYCIYNKVFSSPSLLVSLVRTSNADGLVPVQGPVVGDH